MARRQSRPLKATSFRRPGGRKSGRRGLAAIRFTAPLAAVTALFLWGGGPPGFALGFGTPVTPDRESASFTRCTGPKQFNCVIDGDTFRYRGDKIRIADINAPEVSKPRCAHEARLGEKATDRLQALLNAGPFTLEREPFGRDRDRYDRLLRDVTRRGESLGGALVNEGLAERWKGYRGNWC